MEQQSKQQASYLGPFLAMVFLFFIVGFLTTANTQFQGSLKETFLAEVGGLKNTFATLITFSWFLAYPLSGGVGSRWINRYGYKGTLIRGLVVMIVGLGLFFLSSWFTVRFPEAAWRAGESVVPYGFLTASSHQSLPYGLLRARHAAYPAAGHRWVSQLGGHYAGALLCDGRCLRWLVDE